MPKAKHSLNRLPSLPTIAVEILNVFGDPDAPIQRVAQLVQADPAMASKILKAANSSRFGLAREVADLRQAIALMGKAKITPIVLSFSLASESIEDEEHAAHFQRFWLRSFAQATAGEVLGAAFGPGFASECFTVNLLAGIGQLALLKNGVDVYLDCIARAESGEDSLENIERETYGTTNKELALEMLEKSGLPVRCIDAIATTKAGATIQKEDSDGFRLGQIARIADSFAKYLCDADPAIGMILVQERLGELDSTTLNIDSLSTEVRHRLEESASLFNIDPSELPEPEDLLQEALEQLSDFTERMHDDSTQVPGELLAENGRLKRQVEDLVKQTSTDALTTVANRAFFDRRLGELTQQCLRRQCEMGIAVVDIDHFKHVNDTYGHQAGDHILQQVAAGLEDVTRSNETLARYGGEEFAILLEDIKPGGMTIFGERVRSKVEGLEIRYGGELIPITISIGISTGVPDSDTYGLMLFANADSALYEAKQSGRNRVVISQRSSTVVPAPSESQRPPLTKRPEAAAH